MKPAYIYALIDPITEEVRYVGKTINPATRLYDHCNQSAAGNNPHKMRWILGLRAQDMLPKMIVLEECLPDTWEEAEIRWIAHYRASGAPLTNILGGGRSSKAFQPRAPSKRVKAAISVVYSREYRIPTVDLTEDLHARLETYIASFKKKPTKADIVRAALDKFLPKAKKKASEE